MSEQIFRKEAMDRISSPEELNDYIKVAKPGIWVLLAAIIAFLVGFSIWGIFGTLETTVDAVVVSNGQEATLYVNEDSVDSLTDDMVVKINDTEYSITDVSAQTVNATDFLDDTALHAGGLSSGDWVYSATVDAELEDGIYEATLITEKVNPISFITN